ncbi:DUF362 domain-containing protein [Chloroflexota bacterium]
MSEKGRILIRNTEKSSIGYIVKEAFHIFLEPTNTMDSCFIIKPNLGFRTGAKGGTTSTDIIKAILKEIRDNYRPRNIYLVESDGLAFRCEEVFEYLGLDKVCSEFGAEFINISKAPTVKVKNNSMNILNIFDMPAVFMEDNTRLINLPKIKTHEVTGYSGAIKNLYGLNPYVFKVKYHPVIALVLQDLYNIFKPDLTIVDGIWAIDGHGPWTGEPINLNLIISGDDALHTDMECLKIIGREAEDIPYLENMYKSQGATDYSVTGDTYQPRNFQWQPMSGFGKFKERMARLLVPLFEKGIPLFYYSRGSFKLIIYGRKGKYCKSIFVFPKQKD